MSTMKVTSDGDYLVAAFEWARQRALDWVQTSASPDNLPSYWAGYPHRPLFYSRDVCHQAVGAHLLGLDRENLSMFKVFAASATLERGWYPLWSFHFDGQIGEIDYVDDSRFVREIPAVFELTCRGLEQFAWTGDRRWIEDPVLWDYYRRSVEDFVALHDEDKDGIPESPGNGDIFEGTATYNEQADEEPLVVASDGLATQFAAELAVARACEERGQVHDAVRHRLRAASIRGDFLRDWWDPTGQRFARGRDRAGHLVFGFGKETSWYVPLLGLCGTGEKAATMLNAVEAGLAENPPTNIEAFTYLPGVFHPYGRDDVAWRWLKHLVDSRDIYPEVSFTVVDHLVTGLLGLEPDAGRGILTTRSHLPAEIRWLQVDDVPIGAWRVSIRHEGHRVTEVTVNDGPEPLSVICQFADVSGDQTVAVPTLVAPGSTARITNLNPH
jgi:hypothetical protein